VTESQKAVAWITGAGGLIGSYLVRAAAESRAQVPRAGGSTVAAIVGLTRDILDLTDGQAVRERFRRDRPSLIIHCAAISKSVVCERDPALARAINVEATRVLADLADGIPFILFSTDLVFDGAKGWYAESDSVNPLTVYAETKVAAEQIVLTNPAHTVVRTGPNVGRSPTGDRSFNEELRRSAEQGKPMKLFIDEFRCPIPAHETARAVWALAQAGARGLFHIAGSERLSRWEIGQLLLARWEQKVKFEPGSIRDYTGPPRSPDTSLDCTKAATVLGRELPRLSDWLKVHPGEAG
jgi:dTDP-4-dehydrorhamnose reductase